MAKHKAASEVTLVAPEEKNALALWVDRYWKLGAAVALVVTGMILYSTYTGASKRVEANERWELLGSAIEIDPLTGSVTGDLREVEKGVESLRGTVSEGWGQIARVHAALDEREYGTARSAIEELRRSNLPMLTERTFRVGSAGGEMTLVDHLEQLVARTERWEQEHGHLFSNPAPAEDAPEVTLSTTAGDITVVLYPERAPELVENFLKLCREDFYAGTKFHQVQSDSLIQGGDPNTKEGGIETWGQGGPGYTLERQENGLHHFRGSLAMANEPEGPQLSGSQFLITARDLLGRQGQSVVFGTVTGGLEAVEEIAGGEIEDPASGRPLDPVTLLSTEVNE